MRTAPKRQACARRAIVGFSKSLDRPFRHRPRLQEIALKLSFHGADRSVTGSCHLLEAAGRRILVDCGLFQGSREINEENAAPLGFDPAAIDYLLPTHAHADHCGRLPVLAKLGFKGEVIATAATRELARLVLLDAANLQQEDAGDRARTTMRRGADDQARPPLYSVVDALNSLDRFGRSAVYGQPIEPAARLRVTFIDAGHILGSASVFVETGEPAAPKVLFSGDLGNADRPLLRPPAVPPQADIVVMETTYGDREHKPFGASIAELYDAIVGTFARGGNVVIPTFALERAQELLFVFQDGQGQGLLSKSAQVFLDSPMAISATEVFGRHPESLEPRIAKLIADGRDPFGLPGLHFVRERAESIAVNAVKGRAIIMAGSGMATGGRVRHHLKHNLWREESSVVFVGYAAEGTLARQIIDGAKVVRIFDETIPVRARIHTINGFSAHADQAELLAWHQQTAARITFLVHGEEDTMLQFSKKLAGTQVEMPKLHQTYAL
jgi:metallo-beta-lactamase family protein